MHTIAAYPPEFLELAAAHAETLEHDALQYLLSSPEFLSWVDEWYPEVRHESDSHAYAHMMRLAAGCFALGWSMASLIGKPVGLARSDTSVTHRQSN